MLLRVAFVLALLASPPLGKRAGAVVVVSASMASSLPASPLYGDGFERDEAIPAAARGLRA
jgi:hypothetical protein